MLRMYYMIITHFFVGLYYILMLEYIDKHLDRYNLLSRYEFCVKAVRRANRVGRITVRVTGTENLPAAGGYLMVANHQGRYDALAFFSSHEKPFSFVVDEGRSHAAYTGQFCRLLDGVRLFKDDLRESLKALKEISRRIDGGMKYLIFPEGGYDDNRNTVMPFKPGAFKAATYVNAPIVPVALVDTYKVFGINSLRRVEVQIHYLPPLYYEDYAGMNTTQIAAVCRERIIESVNGSLALPAAKEA